MTTTSPRLPLFSISSILLVLLHAGLHPAINGKYSTTWSIVQHNSLKTCFSRSSYRMTLGPSKTIYVMRSLAVPFQHNPRIWQSLPLFTRLDSLLKAWSSIFKGRWTLKGTCLSSWIFTSYLNRHSCPAFEKESALSPPRKNKIYCIWSRREFYQSNTTTSWCLYWS
jgi:hypothetical protein